MRDHIPDNSGFTKDAVTALVTNEDQNRVKRMDSRLQGMLQGLVNKTLEEKLNSDESETRFLPKIEEAATPR